MLTKEQLKKTWVLRTHLDDVAGRRFLITDNIRENHRKRYMKTNESEQLYSFATEYYGMTSDCYILYALCVLGVADMDTIRGFLTALAAKYPELRVSCESKAVIMERIRKMYKMGLVCKVMYDIEAEEGMNSECVSLCIAAPYANELVRQALSLVIPVNKGIELKRIDELAGWASGARIGVEIANNCNFVDYLHRYLRTKQIGTFYFPCELLVNADDVNYYIAVMVSYLRMDKEVQTPRMYAEMCAHRVNMIKNYLNCRTTKGVPIVVVAVRDNEDLNKITTYIHESNSMTGYYGNIYFTGEGIINHEGVDFKNSFLQMVIDSESEAGYEITHAEPIFV